MLDANLRFNGGHRSCCELAVPAGTLRGGLSNERACSKEPRFGPKDFVGTRAFSAGLTPSTNGKSNRGILSSADDDTSMSSICGLETGDAPRSSRKIAGELL